MHKLDCIETAAAGAECEAVLETDGPSQMPPCEECRSLLLYCCMCKSTGNVCTGEHVDVSYVEYKEETAAVTHEKPSFTQVQREGGSELALPLL